MTDMKEVIQFSAETNITGNLLTGLAHVYGTRALVRGQYEEFSGDAFKAALKHADVRAFYQHDPAKLLGRQSSGTLRLNADGEGLGYEIDLPDTSYANDLRVLMDRGDINEMSFGFIPGEVEWRTAKDGIKVRRHLQVRELIDVSPVSIPAFGNTSLQLRGQEYLQEPDLRTQLVIARMRALKRKGD